MPEENLEAASIETEQTETESAPVETPDIEPEVENEPTEKSTNTVETKEEKMVPLTALQQERQRTREEKQRAKELEDYVRSLQETYAESEDPTTSRPMTVDEYERRERERVSWQQAEEKFPELKDPEIRDLVEARREREMIKNQHYLSIEDSARLTVDFIKRNRSEGQKSAQSSVEIQKRESTSGGVSNKSSDSENLVNVIRNSDSNDEKKSALLQLLKR